jgi:glyoxylase-like metal-dependent hydrolase (beta-lactamase superfamily II)
MSSIRIGNIRVDRVIEHEGPYAALDFLLPSAKPEPIAANADWLSPRFLDATNQVVMCFQSFVVRTAHHTILVDACVGNDKERPLRPNWHRQKSPFLEKMIAGGVRPEEIDVVFCTHLHADHVGWNTQLVDGRWVPTFPNARYLFARREYEYWERAHREALANGKDVPNHGSFGDSVLPIVEAKRATLVESDHEIETGVHLEPAYGHTPGTCLLHAKQGGEHGVFIGDVLHTPVQFVNPDWSTPFCADPAQSGRTRRGLCERYADTGTTILAAHFPSPTVCRIGRHGESFRLRD